MSRLGQVPAPDSRAAPLTRVTRATHSPARTIRAALFATVAVAVVIALRARGDGPRPSLLLLLAVTTLIALIARPLTARERGLPALIGSLIGVQLVVRAVFLLASTGHLTHAGSAGLFCSPAAPGTATLSCLPTERGGFVLLAVQLVAGIALAGWLRDIESLTWNLARLFASRVTTLVGSVISLLAFVALLLASASPITPALVQPPSPEPDDATPHRLLFTRSFGRRGPPTTGFAPALSGLPSRAGFRGSAALLSAARLPAAHLNNLPAI